MSPVRALWWRQARWELGLNLRNGEQLLLVIVIPVAVFLAATSTDFLPSLSSDPVRALGTVLTISVLASAFTSVAIATAFERRSGALLYMSTTPLGRLDVVIAKVIATLLTVLISCAAVLIAALITQVDAVLGSVSTLPITTFVIVLGTIASASWALVLASTVRAEGVLALANALFVIFILFGGVLIPLDQLPGPWAAVAGLLLPGALAESVTTAVASGSLDLASTSVVALWAAIGVAVSSRAFRWS
jgi:ABC-2 type transport system permease protein